MGKCIIVIVTVAAWSQITSGRAYRGLRTDSNQNFHHSFEHFHPEQWHEGLPQWDSSEHHIGSKHRDLETSASSTDKPYWRQHHAGDWDSGRWPDHYGHKQWGHGSDSWPNQGWNHNKPHGWNHGKPSWNHDHNNWSNQERPNSWNNQGGSWDNQAVNNWDNQGDISGIPGGNQWNDVTNGWNTQNTPDASNPVSQDNDQDGANTWINWNNQNQPNTWNNQGGSNINQNNNKQKPTRVPQATTASPDQLQIILCIRDCPVTPEYNPVCGSNNVTYGNIGRLECAKYCGVDVTISRSSPCSVAGTSTTAPQSELDATPSPPTEPTRFTSVDPNPTSPTPPFTISPDIINSIFTTTEDDNVDIDIRTRNRAGVPESIPQCVYPIET